MHIFCRCPLFFFCHSIAIIFWHLLRYIHTHTFHYFRSLNRLNLGKNNWRGFNTQNANTSILLIKPVLKWCSLSADVSALVGCWSSFSIRRIIYKLLNVCPFYYTSFAVSGKVGYPYTGLTTPVRWLSLLQLTVLSRSAIRCII